MELTDLPRLCWRDLAKFLRKSSSSFWWKLGKKMKNHKFLKISIFLYFSLFLNLDIEFWIKSFIINKKKKLYQTIHKKSSENLFSFPLFLSCWLNSERAKTELRCSIFVAQRMICLILQNMDETEDFWKRRETKKRKTIIPLTWISSFISGSIQSFTAVSTFVNLFQLD